VKKDVYLFDTTLRDGEQAEQISFSLDDKIKIALKLDEFGIDYIEGGWPGSNPKAINFFKEIKKYKIQNAKITAFGSTRYHKNKCENDPNIQALIEVDTPAVAIFGKTWDLHVTEALRVPMNTNIEMIYDSIAYLKSKGKIVIYDAEHFFDGFKGNKKYAIRTVKAAIEAGADNITLCDTNGGSMPTEVDTIIKEIKGIIGKTPLGIHTHNDSGLAVANSLIAVNNGATLVQGTINGYGERTGNADLIVLIPNIQIKYKKKCVDEKNLKKLTDLSWFVSEIANLPHDLRQPYVGACAFTHKGGIHVSAVQRNVQTYEHISPELVGNKRRVLISDQSGKSNLIYKAEERGIDISSVSEELKGLLEDLKQMENEGYEFEAAEGTFELLLDKLLGKHKKFFELKGFRVINEKRSASEHTLSEATVKLVCPDGIERHTAADGDGPVNALDRALRKALLEFYPVLKNVKLTDFKVRVINAAEGTAAKVRVLIESSDGKSEWGTVGVSENIVEASYRALVDSIEYKLLKEEEKAKKKSKN